MDLLVGGWQINSIDTFQPPRISTTVRVCSIPTESALAIWQIPRRLNGSTLRISYNRPRTPSGTRSVISCLVPGTKQFDVSLFKSIHFNGSGTRYLQFRAEAFNVFNIPQFNNPNAQIGGSTAGKITSAGQHVLFQRTSREIQLAAKLYF
jgi:hypothetical protein